MRERMSCGQKLRLFAEFYELITAHLCSISKYQSTLRTGVSCLGLSFTNHMKKGHSKLSIIKRGHVCKKNEVKKEGIPIGTILLNKSPSQRSSARCSSNFLPMKLRRRLSKEYIILQIKIYYNITTKEYIILKLYTSFKKKQNIFFFILMLLKIQNLFKQWQRVKPEHFQLFQNQPGFWEQKQNMSGDKRDIW